MKTSHTPGPWEDGPENRQGVQIVNSDGFVLAVAFDAPDFPARTNARVMAAGPALLRELQQLLDDAAAGRSCNRTEAEAIAAYWPKRVASIRAAIAKATGSAS